MKKTNLNLQEISRKNALKCGALALALVAMTGCKDDALDVNGPTGTDVVETVDGVDLSVLSNPALAKTFYNSRAAFGSRAANDVPEFPGMPAIPTADELAAMNPLDGNSNLYYYDPYTGTPDFYIKGNVNRDQISTEVKIVDRNTWQTVTAEGVVKYYIDGNVAINGIGGDGTREMEIHILNGGTLSCNSNIPANTTLYIHQGGKILRAGNENYIDILGNVVTDADLILDGIDIKTQGNFYTTGKLHGKTVTLIGAEIYAGCSVTAEETVYLTGSTSVISTGYVSAPIVELAGGEPLTVLLRDGGYLYATDELRLKDIGNVFVMAADGDYAMVETDVLDVNTKDLKDTFYNVAIKYNSQIGTQEIGAGETEVQLEWNETTQVNGDIEYTVEDSNDPCAPKVVTGPEDPTPDPDPELENIGQISPAEHTHPISATCIYTVGKDAYLSWHTQGGDFHGCIEHLTVDNGQVTLNSYLETAPANATYGAIDFNHVIFDNGKIFVAGDHPKKGGILGWIDCNGGTFPTGNEAKLNLITLYKEQYIADGDTLYSNGGSGNCIIRNGEYYQTASVAGFETFNVSDFAQAADWKLKSIAKLPSWKFDPTLAEAPANPWQRDGSRTGKHIATDGAKVAMLTLINRDNVANTANASIKVFNAADVNYTTEIASYVVEDVLLSPVDGKDVIAIEGNDIWVCLGQGGVKHLTLAGNTLTEVASFRLADKSKEELKGWEMSVKEAAAACANGLAVDNNYVYIAHGGAGLIVLKKDDLSFVTRTRYAGGNSANYISINPDGYIYVAYGKSKVQVYAWKK